MTIWEALLSVYAETGTLSYELVLGVLDVRKKRHAVGGEVYLASLFDKAAPVSHILVEHVKAIKKDAQRRAFQHGAGKLARIAKEAAHSNLDETLQSLRDTTSQMIADEPQRTGKPSGYDIPEAVRYITEHLEEAGAQEAQDAISSGVRALDGYTSGFHPGELMIVAARPGVGKTALAISVALSVAEAGMPVLFFSLEMPLEQLYYRAISQRSDVPLSLFRRPKELKGTDWEEIHIALGRLNGQQLVFDATATLTVEELAIRSRSRKHKSGLGLVVVDYLQLIHVPNETFREQAVAHVSRSLKRLALELEVPVIALSQLNRAVEHRSSRAPVLSDLRESGSIEQDADTVIFVHRPAVWDKDADPSDAELIIAKQRNGPLGRLDITFDEHTTRFKDAELIGYYEATERERARQGDTEF